MPNNMLVIKVNQSNYNMRFFFFILCDNAEARRLVSAWHLSFDSVASKTRVRTSLFCFCDLFVSTTRHQQRARAGGAIAHLTSRRWTLGKQEFKPCVCVCE